MQLAGNIWNENHQRASSVDARFRENQLSVFPSRLASAINKSAIKLRDHSRKKSNLHVLNLAEESRYLPLTANTSDSDIKSLALSFSEICDRKQKWSLLHVLDKGYEILDAYEIQEPNYTSSGLLARFLCQLWWRRQLRAKQRRGVDEIARKAGLVTRYKEQYCSNEALSWRRQQKASNAKIFSQLECVNQEGQIFEMSELVEKSVSNPVIRRGELMTRISGVEQWAKKQNLLGVFYTITCPSKYHAVSKKYQGYTVRESQKYLTDLWARVRAVLKKMNVNPLGIRVAEPHGDGAPHWHLLLFIPEHQKAKLTTVLESYSLEEDTHETGASKYRFKAVAIDPNKGSASGYIAKYICKNIDGFGVDGAKATQPGKSSVYLNSATAAERIEAWSSIHGVRQFQFIGCHFAPIGVWRELRRLRDVQDDEHLEAARMAADSGDFYEYMILQAKQVIEIVKDEVNQKVNKYLDLAEAKVKGVITGAAFALTRFYEWIVRPKQPEIIEKTKPLFSWSPVNNCNPEPKKIRPELPPDWQKWQPLVNRTIEICMTN